MVSESTSVSFGRSRRLRVGELPLAPLIDIVFQLILFFALTLSIQNMQSMRVSLPAADSATSEISEVIIVTITEAGAVYVNGNLAARDIELAIRKEMSATGHSVVRIEADEAANVGAAVRVLDAARTAGASAASIATNPAAGNPQE